MPKVMLIEDDHSLASLLKEYVQHFGFDIAVNNNPVSALRCIKSENFDLIITDVNMFPMSGFELVSEIRSFNEDVKIIAISGSYADSDSHRSEAKKKLDDAGVNAFLGKPFSMDDLKNKFEELNIVS